MHTKKEDFEKILDVWNKLIEQYHKQLRQQKLSKLKISALAACVGDCYQSFDEIYFVLIPKLQKALNEKNYDMMDDCVLDIYWAFDHIKNHIVDAQKGFLGLSRQLEKLDEEKNKKRGKKIKGNKK